MNNQNQSTFPRMHVSMFVSDVIKTEEFYSQFFDQKPSKVKKGYVKFELENPSLIISFIEGESPAPQFGHLGFQVETKEELNQKLNLARARDLVKDVEIGTSCCYAIQDKFWVSDPDGFQWEVYYFHQDVEFNDPRLDAEKGVACCSDSMETKKEETACC